MAFKVGDLFLCPLDLVKDSKTNHLSTTKIWQHIGFIFMTDILYETKPMIMTYEYVLLFTIYSATVAGSYVAVRFINRGLPLFRKKK